MKSKSHYTLVVHDKYPLLAQYLIETFQATDCHLVIRSDDEDNERLVAYLAGQSLYENNKLQCAADDGVVERKPDFICLGHGDSLH